MIQWRKFVRVPTKQGKNGTFVRSCLHGPSVFCSCLPLANDGFVPKDPFFRTRVRFDGLTRAGDVRLAGELGVDAIGFDFARDARRRLRIEDARFMRNVLAPLVASVAIFRDNSADEVREIVRLLRPALIEFHGEEDDARMRSFGVPYARALRRAEWATMSAAVIRARYPNAAVFVLYADGIEGGESDWSRTPRGLGRPVMLAGGIIPDNVSAIIGAVGPWGVSVLDGIEFVPGRVDGDRMNRFLHEARGGTERRRGR